MNRLEILAMAEAKEYRNRFMARAIEKIEHRIYYLIGVFDAKRNNTIGEKLTITRMAYRFLIDEEI